MSALPPKVDMCTAVADVRFGQIVDIHSSAPTERKTPGNCPGFALVDLATLNQPGHSDRPVHAPRVKFAFSFAVPAAISNTSSETLKASVSSSFFIVLSIMALILLSDGSIHTLRSITGDRSLGAIGLLISLFCGCTPTNLHSVILAPVAMSLRRRGYFLTAGIVSSGADRLHVRCTRRCPLHPRKRDYCTAHAVRRPPGPVSTRNHALA